MPADFEPTFPALLVHDEGSITVISSLDEWYCDPDLWWVDSSDFIVDHRGMRFGLTPSRDPKGDPMGPPIWRAVSQVAAPDLAAFVLRHLASERIDPAHYQTALAGFIVDYLSRLDAC